MSNTLLTPFDLRLLAEGNHYKNYEKLGAHLLEADGVKGTRFAVWAPNAKSVAVIGDFNDWDRDSHPMRNHPEAGVWEVFVPAVGRNTRYKYFIRSRAKGYEVEKADPYAFATEMRPGTASKVWNLADYDWGDAEWMASRAPKSAHDAPISIYEVHLGSWMRVPDEGGWLTYRDLAPRLAEYAVKMGFTHVELLPVTEHPFDGSWGYQTVSYYAPTARFGTPQEFKFLVDTLHQAGLGVFLDWAPAHFPKDEHGLGYFDGTHLYEHADPRRGHHPDWDTFIFNYGRKGVVDFLIGSALFWLDRYHIDGLRVDAVASMLYLDYGRKEDEWVPNQHGGHENLEAIDFLRRLNERVNAEHPGTVTIAEESTAWPMVSRPTSMGGLGFGFKWNMGWMNDTLAYIEKDPLHRMQHHKKITFSTLYAFSENFILPFSHDEVVHMKGSMLDKMPGDEWQKFANLRTLYGYLFTYPGKKLLFMGSEFGQGREWTHDESLEWHLLDNPRHAGLRRWVQDLNRLYRSEDALFEIDSDSRGFEWIDGNDRQRSVISFLRRGVSPNDELVVVCNFTPVPREGYRIGVPHEGCWQELLNSDATCYGGSGVGNLGGLKAETEPTHGRSHSLNLTLPPLGCLIFKRTEC
ncbi:MAG: 1,4-alpha-glucan branching protein GlgB [Bryobacterales bacterium]|nr:1,4-alpha-glucan branching protein GlgB [Bryobacterales bacterium]MDE0293588.1 1,4-alpha-glucan branching protein GlgB [Bryobacterales bacterium]